MKSGKNNLLRFLISFILILLVFYLSASVVSAAGVLEEKSIEYILNYFNLEVVFYNYFSLI
ncbi:MAG: hypothetical protein ACQERL_09100 [Bacillota bacterium]